MFHRVSICLLLIITTSECANILAVFPTPYKSHCNVFRPFVNELVKRGHQVTVITAEPEFPKGKSPQNLTEIDLHDLSYDLWNKGMAVQKRDKSDVLMTKVIIDSLYTIFEEQIKSSEVQKLINDKEKSFDLLIIESCVRPAIGFSYIYKSPVIEISSLGPIYTTFDITSAAINPLIYPITLPQRINNITIWEQYSAIYTHYAKKQIFEELEKTENVILKKTFGQDIPDIKELKNNVQMKFLNVHPMWDFNRPVSSNFLYLGNLQQKPTKNLSEDIKSFLDSSKNGVIYISFGTNIIIADLSSKLKHILVKVFSQLSYDILWKWDEDKIPGLSKNVKILKWLPQPDLLKHPNVKLFITQGGLQSTDEAITAGVPLIGVPMLVDQWYNTEMYMKYDIGVKLNINSISENNLKEAIKAVIENPKYRENVIKLRNLMHDKPQTSLERAVWWTEHVLRHGNAEHLRTPAAHMHWTEYYALDLVLLFLSITTIVIIISAYVIYFIGSILYFNMKLIFKGTKTKQR